jgi:hypothetical protein
VASTTFIGPVTSTNGFIGNQVDANGNTVLGETGVASAVNYANVTNSITGVAPTIAGAGANTNVGLILDGKGTGQVMVRGASVFTTTVFTDATAGPLTYTAAQLLGGLILRDCAGGGRADTVPTAALMVAAIPGCIAGDSFEFVIRNTSGGATSITLTPVDGTTVISGTATIAQSNSKRFRLVIDVVTAASEAYTIYSLGTSTF